MTPEIQNELALIRGALAQAGDSVLMQNARRALEIVAAELRPFGYAEVYPLRACVWRRRDEWVLELEGTINDTNFTSRHPQPGHLPPEDVPMLPVVYVEVPNEETRAAIAQLEAGTGLKFQNVDDLLKGD